MRVLAIIPARYASTRFPAKPLAMLGRKCIIEWVWSVAKSLFDDVIVATDDERIAKVVEGFGGVAMMTSSEHRCGTERCAEVARRVGDGYDIILNIQGDEPFIQREQLSEVVAQFANPDIDIATLAAPIPPAESHDIFDPNCVKVTLSDSGRALYFSRSPIPYIRGVEREEWASHHTYYRHLGIYAFRREVLQQITQLTPTPLEMAESLEQLRWLQSGYTIGVGLTSSHSIGIDTPEDLERAETMLSQE